MVKNVRFASTESERYVPECTEDTCVGKDVEQFKGFHQHPWIYLITLHFEGMHICKLGCNCGIITLANTAMTYKMFDHILYDGDAEESVDQFEALGVGFYLCQPSRIIRNSAVQKYLPPERAASYACCSCSS